ncbi:MAG: hypothetical protein KJ011_02355 [Burkholderiaceae bacterium]|nr:hypothetical protein [Burkholderiaceae bacterium]
MRGVLTRRASTAAPAAASSGNAALPRRARTVAGLLAAAALAGMLFDAGPAAAADPVVAAGRGPAGSAHAGRTATAGARAPAAPVQSAATLYALNCMGCHPPPRTPAAEHGPLRGEFYHSALGRNFFIRVPQDGKRVLDAQDEARLLEEIMTWKRSCAAILQDAPHVNYSGERFVK